MGKAEYDDLSKSIFDNYNQTFRNSELISEYKELFNI